MDSFTEVAQARPLTPFYPDRKGPKRCGGKPGILHLLPSNAGHGREIKHVYFIKDTSLKADYRTLFHEYGNLTSLEVFDALNPSFATDFIQIDALNRFNL